MIDQEFFLGFPFPWLLRNSTGLLIARGDGALFPLSPTAQTKEELDHLLRVRHGWTCCPSGYAAYVSSLSTDEQVWLVVHGLKVVGISSIRGREQTLSIRMNAENVESYVKRTIAALAESKEKLLLVMRTNIHEVRSINTDIYNAVYRLKQDLQEDGYIHQRYLNTVRNIEELSKILKTRTDVLDVVSNPALLKAARSLIPIYRAFDRVIRSLTPTASSENVRLQLTGSSTGRVDGIALFDVIPYLMIQNAIKYAPPNTSVEIHFSENSDRVHVHLSSVGPSVEEDEVERIFISGFRGRHARQVTPEGTGIGMNLLKTLVEMHDGGSVKFSQEKEMCIIHQLPYTTTHLEVSINLFKSIAVGNRVAPVPPHRSGRALFASGSSLRS